MLDKIINPFENAVDNYAKSRIRIRLPLTLATTPKKVLGLHFNDIPCSKSSLSTPSSSYHQQQLHTNTVWFCGNVFNPIFYGPHWWYLWSFYGSNSHFGCLFDICLQFIPFVTILWYSCGSSFWEILHIIFLANFIREFCKEVCNRGDIVVAQAYYFRQYWHANSRARYTFQFIGKYVKYIGNTLLNHNIISLLCHEDLRIVYILIIELSIRYLYVI